MKRKNFKLSCAKNFDFYGIINALGIGRMSHSNANWRINGKHRAYKKGVRWLYEKHPSVHLDVSFTHPKLHLENDPVVIKGVYANFFRIEEYSSGHAQCHSLQYADVLTGHIRMHELKI